MQELTRANGSSNGPDPSGLPLWGGRGGLLAVAVAALAWVLAPSHGTVQRAERDLQLALELERQGGIMLDRETAPHWLRQRQGALESRWQHTWVVVRALPLAQANHDIYSVAVRLSPEGELLNVVGAYNLTDTSLADEGGLVANGDRIAWTVPGQGRVYHVEYANLHGAAAASAGGWSRLMRLQQGLTNLQQTGQFAEIERRSFRLDPAAQRATLELDAEQLSIDADGRVTIIPTSGVGDIVGQRHIQEEPRIVAPPGELATWAVDRARDLPWVGSERVQFVKAVAYKAWDWFSRALPQDDGEEWRRAEALATPAAEAAVSPPPLLGTDDQTDWPPEPLARVAAPGLAGEGSWRSPIGDPFVHQGPGSASPIATTFVRPDAERTDARVAIVAWDPRQIDLRFMAGTREPKSDTGETGSGLVPREPEVITRLIGAFNGGFQTTHGHWGTMVDGKVLAPPRFYAATVARLSDGAVGFGTWPVNGAIPADMQSFRQNLTPLIGGGRINPYGRTWWGGVPFGWEDDTRTVRAGLCLTKAGLVAYFYGSRVDHLDLAKAMLMARCDYAMHLDMNQGHTGFEFYSVGRAAELPPLGFPLDRMWQAEGEVPDLPGYRFRGRRLFPTMQLMHFPRYINRGSRDFFYLVVRRLLPGPDLKSAFGDDHSGEGQWRLEDRGRTGFSPALASTWLRPDSARPESKVRVLKLDLKWLAASSGDNTTSANGLVSFSLPPLSSEALRAEPRRLELSARRARVSEAGPRAEAGTVISEDDDGVTPGAAWGLIGDDILVYAEVVTARDPDRDRALLSAVLAQAGCDATVFSANPALIALAGNEDLAGHPVDAAQFRAPGRRVVSFARYAWQPQRHLFTNTPVVTSDVWYAYQN